jgi:hypothetical protein
VVRDRLGVRARDRNRSSRSRRRPMTRPLRLPVLLPWIVVMMIASVSLRWCAEPAHADARPIAACQWTPLDYAAIAWTVQRRFRAHGRLRGETFEASVISTSAFLRRARYAMTREAAMEANGAPRRNEHLRMHLDAWAAGDVPDPCSGGVSFQWRSPRVHTRMKRVDCGRVANHFVEHSEPFQTRAVANLSLPGEPRCP